MTLVYKQSDGELRLDGEFEGYGYSGTGMGRNNPAAENIPSVGPIPRGNYSIGPAYDHPTLGPIVFNLEPVGHDAHGRSAFRIHGDSANHDASHGCVVCGRTIRERIRDDSEHDLEVIE